MTTLDGDWECEQDDGQSDSEGNTLCFAVWKHCGCVETHVPEYPGYNGGLVPKGEGVSIADEQGNIWFEINREEPELRLADNYDICIECSGSGGGYYCGFHDKDETP